jgi:hypothetical protein
MSRQRGDVDQRDGDLQRQIDDLSDLLAANRTDIDTLEHRADASDARQDKIDVRADASDARQDANDVRADASDARHDASDARQDKSEARIDLLEATAAVDHELIAELRSDWRFGNERAAQLERALRSSRMIGAAIGVVMAERKVTAKSAFATLSCASQNSNVKLRDLAASVVETGDVSRLPYP